MSPQDLLFQIADSQQGYFTARQAEECGLAPANFHRYLASGEWYKELRGIYRLIHYPVTERPELVLWSLWSRNKNGALQGVWSHETALDIYELSDVMPSKLHMTVPPGFRKRAGIPEALVLHIANLSETEVQYQQGYRVTTPLRTLIDVIEEGLLANDLIAQAIKDALRKGVVSMQEIQASTSPNTYAAFMRCLHGPEL